MKLIDLSQPIFHDGPNCPVHPPLKIEIIASHARGDGWHMERLEMASHSGSHVDAPLHKIPGGASIDDIPLQRFCGPARIADLRGIPAGAPIGPEDLEHAVSNFQPGEILLLATGWGEKRARAQEWQYHSPFLSPDGASWLVARGANGVGIDHFSIGGLADPDNSRTHEILLGAGVWIVEDLFFPPDAFVHLPPVKFWALPVNFRAQSGSFCRPVLEIP